MALQIFGCLSIAIPFLDALFRDFNFGQTLVTHKRIPKPETAGMPQVTGARNWQDVQMSDANWNLALSLRSRCVL